MKSTIRQDRALVTLSLANRCLTSSDLCQEWRQSTGVEVSTSTIGKRLLRSGLRGCKAKKKPKVSKKQRKARIAWAKEHLNWTREDWYKVIFSDESTFTIQNHARNNFVRKRPQEAFSPPCISPTLKHPTSVMIWGCMASNGIGRLHICEGMMNATKYAAVLETKLLACARSLFPDEYWIFQDDNAPCHQAKLVKRWMQSHRVAHMNWPAQSPDLNPIENLRHRINVIIAQNKPSNKRELIENIIQAWHHIFTPEELRNYVQNMPRRCKAVIQNKSFPTKF